MKKIIDLRQVRLVLCIAAMASIFSTREASAQTTDTVYFNAKWEKTDRDNKHFYRVISRNDNTKPIRVQDFYPNGVKQMDGWYSSLEPEVRDGDFTWWHEDGIKHRKMTFDKGEPTKITEWDKEGKITRQQEAVKTVSHINGERVRDRKALEKAPVFNRGKSSFPDYVTRHLEYPAGAEGISGEVIVRFVVDKNGRTRDAEVVQGVHKVLDDAALDLINSLPQWTPGVLDGKNVDIKMELPLRFNR
ncbi:energy transducer TonB [Sphingobacterium olei]|uniref:Energy transducer TonB n=1 Tax=Sphingobacterium olei TaxID=2571155 RepID=A0A4U0P6A9_9SPHI|nr:energy transducer TonB [Sphingobacterium olei]TJZ62965.1 energy transducer TonB [Sphingobacterium olei]